MLQGLDNLHQRRRSWLPDRDFKRPTLSGVIAATPKLRNLYIGSCDKLIITEHGNEIHRAAAYMRQFNDFYVRTPMTSWSLERLTIGRALVHCIDPHKFFYSLVELTAPKLRRIECFFDNVKEYNRESGRYRLLAPVLTEDRWFGAGMPRRRATPGSERPAERLTCFLDVRVEENDGETVMTV